jgi:hypothetical protein
VNHPDYQQLYDGETFRNEVVYKKQWMHKICQGRVTKEGEEGKEQFFFYNEGDFPVGREREKLDDDEEDDEDDETTLGHKLDTNPSTAAQ